MRCPFSTFLRLQGDHHCACGQKWCRFSFFFKIFQTKKIKALRPKMTKIASRGSCLKLSFNSWVEQNWHFFLWQRSKKLLFTHLGGFLLGGGGGNGGPGKSILRSRVQWACTTRLFLLDLRATCTVFSGVRHVCHDNDGSFGDADPGIPGYKAVEHIFHCLPIVWFFRQAHKHLTKPNNQFLEILTCWTRWQASFFIKLKGKTSKPAQMKSSFPKTFEEKKNWQK